MCGTDGRLRRKNKITYLSPRLQMFLLIPRNSFLLPFLFLRQFSFMKPGQEVSANEKKTQHDNSFSLMVCETWIGTHLRASSSNRISFICSFLCLFFAAMMLCDLVRVARLEDIVGSLVSRADPGCNFDEYKGRELEVRDGARVYRRSKSKFQIKFDRCVQNRPCELWRNLLLNYNAPRHIF